MLPTQVKVKNPVQINCFSNFSLVLDKNGDVWGFGSNLKDRLGMESDGPTQIKTLKKIVKLACGNFHSLALDGEGQCWSTGSNKNGELARADAPGWGQVEQQGPVVDIAAGFNVSFFISHQNDLLSAGKSSLSLNQKDAMKVVLKEIKKVACGLNYICVIDLSGNVYSWGENKFQQLGYSTKGDFQSTPQKIEGLSDVVQISCSKGEKHNHTGCINSSGQVYMWGDPYKGQLGNYPEG